jgi:hypothetical protein
LGYELFGFGGAFFGELLGAFIFQKLLDFLLTKIASLTNLKKLN